jgi:uncharacterized protein (DUF4415 family)
MKQNALRSSQKTVYPTAAEDRAIRAGIAADPDTHELTRAEIGTLRPASQVLSPQMMAQLRSGKAKVVAESDAQWQKRTRKLNANGNAIGRPPKEDPKVAVTVRLDSDVVRFFRDGGDGWQTRLNALLAAHVKRASKRKPAKSGRKVV